MYHRKYAPEPSGLPRIILFIIAIALALVKLAAGAVPYAVNVGSNSVKIVSKRFYYLSDAPAYKADTTYAQGDYASVSGRIYMAMSADATNAPAHAKGIIGEWLSEPYGSRTAAVITLHTVGPVYLAYGDDAIAVSGTLLTGEGASETISDYHGDVRAICAGTNTTAVIGVAER